MLSGSLRRSLFNIAPKVVKGIRPENVVRSALVRTNVTLQDRERGEEASYIRRQEHDAHDRAVRAKLEEILKRGDDDADKHALNEVMSKHVPKKDEEVGWIKYYSLDDWRYALPAGLCIGAPAVMHGVVVVDGYFYYLCIFTAMLHAWGSVAVPIWNEKMADTYQYMEELVGKADKKIAMDIDQNIKTNENFVEVKETFQDMFNLTDNVAQVQAEALNKASMNKYEADITRKLEALNALNEGVSASIRVNMLDSVKDEVSSVIQNDSAVKEAALSSAIAALAAGPKGKRGKDVVGEVFKKAISNYQTKASAKDSFISKAGEKLDADIAAIVEAPEHIKVAGNVYETHPAV